MGNFSLCLYLQVFGEMHVLFFIMRKRYSGLHFGKIKVFGVEQGY